MDHTPTFQFEWIFPTALPGRCSASNMNVSEDDQYGTVGASILKTFRSRPTERRNIFDSEHRKLPGSPDLGSLQWAGVAGFNFIFGLSY
jgi:hypothetical protein